MKNYFQKKDGFGIIEVMAAVFIIVFGMIGILALSNQNIKMQRVNKNTFIASQLAQEGLELVRNTRDRNWLSATDWKFGAGVGTGTDIIQDGSYSIDYIGNIINVNEVSDFGANLKIDSNGFYQHGSGVDSLFNRMISVVDNGDSIVVSVLIRWREGTGFHNYSVEEVLYNWR